MWELVNWDYLYSLIGIKDFVYFVSSPSIQDKLWPIKIVFFYFTIFFFCAVFWFYQNSSYLKYKFLQDTSEFLRKETYGLRKVGKSWKKIQKRIDLGTESELKLAIIEADDMLYEVLGEAGYEGVTFDEIIDNASKKIVIDREAIDKAHKTRNAIVYEPDYKVDLEEAVKILSTYESAVKNISIS